MTNSNNEQVQIKVLIVGAGLAGLVLAILLDKLGIDYDLFERSRELRPLGSAMTLGANILPVFEQLGIYEEFVKLALPIHTMDMYNEDLSTIGSMDSKPHKEAGGYPGLAFGRPALHKLLLSKVPAERVHYGKKVLSTFQGDKGVLIRTSDGKSHEGDLLVGADGAHSAVRQCLFEQLTKEGRLPKSDSMKLDLGYNCMVGITGELDLEKYPGLRDGHCHFATVLANSAPHSWRMFVIPGNRICWSVSIQVTTEEEKNQTLRNSEWGAVAVDDMIKLVEHHRIPIGGTLSDLIKATPRNVISKVYLEEKFFETWYHDRTVLIGDEDITMALQSYKDQRYWRAKAQFDLSQKLGKVMYGHKLTERWIRHAVLNWMPASMHHQSFMKSCSYRPQAVFLPLTPNRGTVPALPQHESRRLQSRQVQAQAL
ncbi:hypothetical protein BGZ83_006114 [Gryganskiella cystojenkinii]|nr:hypothetical protein BGZ83_006114 [Gryganskiella cystojenkinii]